ncbi:hypothetical protein AVT43_gp48 [Polaribacter phage P12002L]|uniref:DUF6965 domain-containing protein n=2 Tax=Incheonvirus TaxID=2976977 RepID=A0A0F7IKM2_9CAUD|nr:hypothetical protein AVT42_gp46 [Polaribacter phage P12002S]YP_009209708.1 hypothetical protein AVT43_gp48 [Polaribacter phage P12002L]AKG94222.1 hypothetical protein P12002L_0048 [Polaribacter phage P12002L]AKG94302.1 hypothetical protein P12002S_0046 [Polaribacter phage P12002S]
MEKKIKKPNLQFLEDFFNGQDLKNREITIYKSQKIINPDIFIKDHISILKRNSGNSLYLPYYDRLYCIYLILKSEL